MLTFLKIRIVPASARYWFALTICATIFVLSSPVAAQPTPVLNSIFPAGGCAGTSVDVTVAGSSFGGLKTLHCSTANLTYEAIDKTHVRINIPRDTPPGFHDLRVVCDNGLSSPRAFMIGTLNEAIETEPNDLAETATLLSLNSVGNGRIDKKGDIDQFQFVAKRGQQIVIECGAERIDSPLRAVLELYDDEGERLAFNRGYFGVDPMIPFRIPADGTYTVKVFDLVYAGGADYVYRLTIGDKPKVVFSHPAVVQSGQTSRVTLFGWNLTLKTPTADPLGTQAGEDIFETLEVDVTPPAANGGNPQRQSSIQADVNSFAFRYRNSDDSIQIGLTDVPVVQDQAANLTPETAQPLAIPCEVGGQLGGGDDHDWYSIDVRRGEVLWLEGFGTRIGSPVDLDISILDASGKSELARFSDNLRNIGGNSFKTSHPDPAGRWVVPADGRYLILVRNVIGDLTRDPRRVYRLSLRREEPDFHLALIDSRDTPAALNIQRGGRTTVDILAFRHRGMNDTIRVSARNLPTGIECPDVYLGPGVNRVPLTLSASDSAETLVAQLELLGHAVTQQDSQLDTGKTVRGGTVVRAGELNNTARLTAAIPFAVTGEAPLRITANGNEPRSHDTYGQLKVRHSPGSILDVAVRVDRRDVSHQAEVQLIGVGLPKMIHQQTAIIPAGQSKGYISYYLPPTLPIGIYTFAIKAVTTTAASSPKGKPQSVTIISNPVTIHVQPAAFVMEMDPYAPTQIARGQVVQVKYSARRINGFIGKIHTELFAPDQVVGLRGRGVTFVGQTESGTIQIIANEDAPLGQQPFVRFYGVGVVEDKPVYHGSCFLKLEITEQDETRR